jgi:hypothetical protein
MLSFLHLFSIPSQKSNYYTAEQNKDLVKHNSKISNIYDCVWFVLVHQKYHWIKYLFMDPLGSAKALKTHPHHLNNFSRTTTLFLTCPFLGCWWIDATAATCWEVLRNKRWSAPGYKTKQRTANSKTLPTAILQTKLIFHFMYVYTNVVHDRKQISQCQVNTKVMDLKPLSRRLLIREPGRKGKTYNSLICKPAISNKMLVQQPCRSRDAGGILICGHSTKDNTVSSYCFGMLQNTSCSPHIRDYLGTWLNKYW